MERARDAYQHKGCIYLPYKVGYASEKDRLDERRCSWCKKCIGDNQFRIGMFVSNSDRPQWHHPNCFWAAMDCGSNTISVDLIDGIDTIMPDDQETLITNLEHFNSLNHADQDITGRTFFDYDETADPKPVDDVSDQDLILLIMPRICFYKTMNQLFCEECSEFIPPGVIGMMRGYAFVHLRCGLRPAGAIIGSLEMSQGFGELAPEDQTTLKLNFARKMLQLEATPKKHPHIFREIAAKRNSILVFSTLHVFKWEIDKYSPKCCFCKAPFAEKDAIVLHSDYYHPQCLFEHVCMIFELPEAIPNWSSLTDETRNQIRILYDWAIRRSQDRVIAMTFPRPKKKIDRKRDHSPEKIAKIEEVDHHNKSEHLPLPNYNRDASEQRMRLQLETCRMLREMFDKLSTETINFALKYNMREVPPNREDSLDQLVDISMFGPPVACPKCKGQVTFSSSLRQYICRAPQKFSHCNFSCKNPSRAVFITPNAYSNYEGFSRHEINTFSERVYAKEKNADENQKFVVKPGIFEVTELAVEKRWLKPEDFVPNRFVIENRIAVREKCSRRENCYLRNYHVFKENGTVYHALLTSVEVQENKNMCMEMYIWEQDNANCYYVARMLSRIGTNIVTMSMNDFVYKEEAIKFFKDQFYEATHNHWTHRKQFRKVPNRFFWVNHCIPTVDDLDEEEAQVITDLIGPLDFTPLLAKRFVLGDLSQCNYQQALNALNDLQYKRDNNKATEWDFINATNIFYTILPTCCGYKPHELLDNRERISNAFKLLKRAKQNSSYEILDLYKLYQERRKTMLPELDRNSDEWKYIMNYHDLNRGNTHDVNSEVLEIYRVNTGNPSEFEAATPRTLLWHGTPIFNIPSIVLNGLKIPETKSLSMFGAGIYFSDCFTKSAFYSRKNEGVQYHAYVLLCEVKMNRTFESNVSMEKSLVTEVLEKGYDTVFGFGKQTPEKTSHVVLDNVLYPIGQLVKADDDSGSLEYNEFVIYDAKQVAVKFIVKLNIKSARYL